MSVQGDAADWGVSKIPGVDIDITTAVGLPQLELVLPTSMEAQTGLS